MKNPDLSRPLLAIDTSTPACSVALSVNNCITQRFHHGHAKHTELLLPMVDALLREAQLTVADLAGIVLSAGPGAFTGLRVGASVAAGLAAAFNTPIGRLSSLALLAAQVCRATHLPQGERDFTITALLDARMNQCYAGHYWLAQNGVIEALAPDCLCQAADLPLQWTTSTDIYLGTGLVYGDDLPLADKVVMADTLPHACDAFAVLNLVDWQDALTPIDIYYLRDDITQH